MISRRSSGLRAESAVEPTRSENITVTWRRSAVSILAQWRLAGVTSARCDFAIGFGTFSSLRSGWMPTSSAMLLPRLQGRVRAWRRTSHKLGRPDDPLGGAPLTNWGKLSRNRTGEGQRQHRDFEGERKGFEGWLARNRRAPAKLHRGSKGTGLRGDGGGAARPASRKRANGGSGSPSRKKIWLPRGRKPKSCEARTFAAVDRFWQKKKRARSPRSMGEISASSVQNHFRMLLNAPHRAPYSNM